MNYEELKEANNWISELNQSYINDVAGAPVFVYKLDKENTKLHELYGEEINGRIYLRPFMLKALHIINKFNFMFSDNMISEQEEPKEFAFNFNEMVQKMYKLKNEPICIIELSSSQNFSLKKTQDALYLFKNSVLIDTLTVEHYPLVSQVVQRLQIHQGLTASFSGQDDYTKNIRNFNTICFKGSSLLLETYIREYRNCSDIIDNGDLIFVGDNNRLYEVTAVSPSGNMGWKYQMWTVKCAKTYPYVLYDKLKKSVYGFDANRIKT